MKARDARDDIFAEATAVRVMNETGKGQRDEMTVDIEPAGLGSAADHAHEFASDREELAAAMAASCELMALHDRQRAAWLRRQAREWRRRCVSP